MKQNRSERTTIRVRPDILELANDIKRERGYSIADIFEMGVLLLDNNNDNDLVIQNQIYSEMIHRFTKLEESIRKECEKIEDNIVNEIKQLENAKETVSKSLDEKGLNYTQDQVNKLTDEIIDLIERRIDEFKYGIQLEPIGKEFFEYKTKTTGIPINTILKELSDKGYDDSKLREANINSEIRWRGYTELKKETI